MPKTRVKICGLSTAETVDAATSAGAAYVGFVFFEKSPRNISFEVARQLAIDVPIGIAKVALVVNANDAFLDEIVNSVPLDMLQLHGNEAPERVTEIKARFGLPVMKAVGIASKDDLVQIETYSEVADQILIDAKPPKHSTLPGGNGLAFDWRLIANRRWSKPWMLAGGLTVGNVAEAITLTGAAQIDVSSGVENSPGQKSNNLIQSFIGSTP